MSELCVACGNVHSALVDEILTWTRARSLSEAAIASLLANIVVFFAALALGATITRMFEKRRVAEIPPPISREEIVLAALCVVLNSVVMFVGWHLFRVGLLSVDGRSFGWWWLFDAILLTVAMDLAMYITHRMAHVPIFYRSVHATHHRYEHPRALTLFVLHPIEVLGFGGLWVAVLCTHAFSLGGMLIYLTMNTLFGVLGHVGVEPLPNGWVRWPLLRRIGTSTFHARHHQRPTSNFGFYTAVWDRLFGTLDPDYATRFARLPIGAPKQRGFEEEVEHRGSKRPC
jgi:lathosterol oxidase